MSSYIGVICISAHARPHHARVRAPRAQRMERKICARAGGIRKVEGVETHKLCCSEIVLLRHTLRLEESQHKAQSNARRDSRDGISDSTSRRTAFSGSPQQKGGLRSSGKHGGDLSAKCPYWAFRDVVFQDVGFQHTMCKTPHPYHISFRCEVLLHLQF